MDAIQDDLDNIMSMDYEHMLRLHRFAPVGHPYFRVNSALGEAFALRFQQLAASATDEELVAASKRVGWG